MTSEQRQAFDEASPFADRGAEIFKGVEHVGLQGKRAPVGCFSLVRLALLEQDISEVAVRRHVVGRNRNQPPQHRRGLVQPALADKSDAEIVVRIGMVGVDLQNAAVNSFRFRQSPGLMMEEALP